ncbi:PadR family transcriptional regulator [Amphibacillus sediminis]|uniref:PadR family transcriptional regulator n=1 Tax=Amphibacillus sediminis TaxID=360185 RepID=UPI000831A4EA|nr:PadR family transcriptional regulator [Amphibacillus sediminis]
MKKTQLLKGVLEGCVLLIVTDEEIYGYEMVYRLRQAGFTDIVAGTVYPLLQKLEKQGYLTSVIKPSQEGPNRKYYQITDQGRQYCEDFIIQWLEITSHVDTLINKERVNDDRS